MAIDLSKGVVAAPKLRELKKQYQTELVLNEQNHFRLQGALAMLEELLGENLITLGDEDQEIEKSE